MSVNFVHLHVHSDYSVVDGLIKIEELCAAARKLKMSALALTEQGNLYSAVKFYKTMHSYGMKPIIGAELTVAADIYSTQTSQVVFLCMDIVGYQNLNQLITKSHLDNRWTQPTVLFEDIQELNTGLIALIGRSHDLGRALLVNDSKKASHLFGIWRECFSDRLYLQIERLSFSAETYYLPSVVDFSLKEGAPLVATNNVRFLCPEDYVAHEVRTCIQQGRIVDDKRRPHLYRSAQYLRSEQQMRELFSDLPAALLNSVKIVERCNLELVLGETHLPDFPVPDGLSQENWFRQELESGFQQRMSQFQQSGIKIDLAHYRERLDYELSMIQRMGFAGYFLIVADFINWARKKQIPVGPGRGSGAGSLAAYVLGITELNPIEHNLLFERFLNPERVSLPDFDIDFCMDRRDEVIAYVVNKYGDSHVSQIITHGKMSAKAVVRDVGRALGYPYGFVDKIARLIPFELDMTLARALDTEDLLQARYDAEGDVKKLINMAQKLEGLVRNASRHAGGIVIAPKPLVHYMPLYKDASSDAIVTQFDMDDVASIGLVKFDFLGLRTLSIIDWAIRDINLYREQLGRSPIRLNDIPLDDPKTYALIKKTKTVCVFQLESDGMRNLIKRLQPDIFEDLTALLALFRPGPLQSGMVDDFIARKHRHVAVRYPHPQLESILETTYGVILYQEQVMQIAQTLAGYSLGNADILRRAMGKKDPKQMAKQRKFFLDGSSKNSIDKELANYIFDLMEKFSGYGFNRSHSAAYALIAYQTAWLKAHYPAAFMAAVFSADMDNTDKVIILCEELRAMGIKLLPPNINHSNYHFLVVEGQIVRFGLGAIKGIGKSVVQALMTERNTHGIFQDFSDFCQRIDLRKINKGALESLIKSGSLDDLGFCRGALYINIDKVMRFSEQFHLNRDSGQNDLFGLSHDNPTPAAQFEDMTIMLSRSSDFTEIERLIGEKETVGFYLQGHPILSYRQELMQITNIKLNTLKAGEGLLAAYIAKINLRLKGQRKMAEVRLDDETGRGILTVYPEVFDRYQHFLLKDELVLVRGTIIEDKFYTGFGYSFVAKEIYTLDEYRQQFARLRLKLRNEDLLQKGMEALKQILNPYFGSGAKIEIDYQNEGAQGIICLGEAWRIKICDKLIAALASRFGKECVTLCYR